MRLMIRPLCVDQSGSMSDHATDPALLHAALHQLNTLRISKTSPILQQARSMKRPVLIEFCDSTYEKPVRKVKWFNQFHQKRNR